jgi:hypothetical protein
MFSPQVSQISINTEELIKKNIVSTITLNLYLETHKTVKLFTFEMILHILILEKFLKSSEVSLEEGKVILRTVEEHYHDFEGKYYEVLVIRKLGVIVCLLMQIPSEIYLESGAKLIQKVNIIQCVEELKTTLLN